MIILTAGHSRVHVLPEVGGSLAGWWLGDAPLLRATDAADRASGDPTWLAGFPLVPYSNRIGAGRFDWAGTPVTLPCREPDEPHALHGLGWRLPWRLTRKAADRATLQLDHPGGPDWPWPFVARQEIVVEPDGLRLELSARNLADQPAPLAIGHHPYFAREAAWLALAADSVWLTGPDRLPGTLVPPSGALDLSAPTLAAAREIDHCYQAVAWPARLGWHGRDHALLLDASSNLPCAVVYSNAANRALCIEPVAHSSNALNRADSAAPMPSVPPGASFSCTITMRIVPAASLGGATPR